MTFSGRTAIVTGGTGALGGVCAERLLDRGLNLGIPYTSEKSLLRIPPKVAAAGPKVFTQRTDLSKGGQAGSFVDAVVAQFGSVDYLVHAAGGYLGGNTLDEVTEEQWDDIMDMNLKASFLMCSSVLRVMRRQGFGHIVNIAAMPALESGANKGPYAVSKRGVVSLTQIISDETKGTGITANAIAPSIILTDANRHSMPSADFSRWVTPQEIAEMALYLCSDEAKSISGNVIKMYGGV